MGIGILSMAEASKASGVPHSTLHRWVRDRAKFDPTLVVKMSKRKWFVSKTALAAMLGLDVTDIEAALDRHGKEIDRLNRRVKVLEGQVRELQARGVRR